MYAITAKVKGINTVEGNYQIAKNGRENERS